MTTLFRLPLLVAAALLSLVLLGGQREAGSAGAPAEIVPGAVLTQPFGCTTYEFEPVDPDCPGGHFHGGIDLGAPEGTPVLAPAAGQAAIGSEGPCGLHIRLNHGGGIETLYCHLSAIAIEEGGLLRPGEALGRIGSTGLSFGPHLHFEVHRNGRPVDPSPWLAALATGSQP